MTTKSNCFEVHITLKQKHQLQHAANLLGRSVTDFAISSLQAAAAKVIREHEIQSLSKLDQKTFIQSLLKAPDPSQRLLKAKKHFYDEVKK